MKRTMRWAWTGLLFSLSLGVAGLQAQQPVSAEPQAPSRTVQTPAELAPALPVPRLVKFAGTLKDELGKARTGVVGVTFAIYKEQEGGAALWLETQNVELDEQGRYTVLLGSSKSEGLPLELFISGDPRWLGVQVNLPKEVEQPRLLLVSVPYALKAADAETLGGKPLSSFVLASPATGSGGGVGTVLASTGAIGAATIGGGGTQNFVAKFDATGANVVNSSIFDTGTNVGLGTASPARSLHIRSAAPTIRLEDTNLPNSFWELQQSAFSLDTFGFLRYENGVAVQDKSFVVSPSGNLGIGTGSPQRKLHIRSSAPVIRLEDTNLPNSFWELQQSAFVLDTFGFLRYENGAAVPSKSFVMSSGGNFGIGTGVPTQKLEVAGNVKISGVGSALTFPDGTVMTSAGAGTNGGTITGVTAGTGLMGGGTSGGVTLNIANGGITNALLGANSVSNANILDGSLSPAKITGIGATLGSNSFMGSQTIAGTGDFVASVANGASLVGYNPLITGAISPRGVYGQADSSAGVGVHGFSNSGLGVLGVSGSGTAGTFNSGVGKILSGQSNGTEVFSVDGAGTVHAKAYQDLAGNPLVRYSSFVPVCDLNVSGAISTTRVNLGTIGTFSKSNASSSIVIDWGGHVSVGTVSNVVQFFLMVDGNPAVGNQPSGLLFSQDAGRFIFLPMHAAFTGLAAGSHNVEIWVSIPNGSASNVAENPGCFNEAVVIQEL